MSRFHFSAWLGLCMWKQAHLFIYLLPYIRRSSEHIFPKLLAHHSSTRSGSSDHQSQSSDRVSSPFICLRHLPDLLFSDAQFLGYSCLLPGSSVHGTHQARLLEWVAIPFSMGSFQLRVSTSASCIAGRFFTIWAARKARSLSILLIGSVLTKYDTNMFEWNYTVSSLRDLAKYIY